MVEHGFIWHSILPLHEHVPSHVFHSCVAVVILAVFGWRIRASLKKSSDPLVPDTTFSIRNVFEIVVQAITSQVRGVIGPSGDRYLWLIGGLFLYIFVCNLLGLVPGFEPPTSNINTNLGMAATVFLVYNYYGFKEHGIKYLKHFTGPVIWLAPLMVLIELMSHVFRPMALSIRLFGNMFADHVVLAIFGDLVPLLVPMIFLVLGMVVCLIQAFVFSLLATVYIGLAVSHDH